MKTLIDVICMRCFSTASFDAVDPAEAIAAQRASHVCADGVRPTFTSPFKQTARRVPGPGERLDAQRS